MFVISFEIAKVSVHPYTMLTTDFWHTIILAKVLAKKRRKFYKYLLSKLLKIEKHWVIITYF
jgi:hypothetical protein